MVCCSIAAELSPLLLTSSSLHAIFQCFFPEKIKQYLLDQLEEDAEMASALLICTVNKDDKVRTTPTISRTLVRVY